MRAAVAVAILLLTAALMIRHTSPTDSSSRRDIVFNKYFLYEQLRIYRSRLDRGAGTTPSAAAQALAPNASKDLPPYPGAELIKPPLQGVPDVRHVDLPRIAYDLFSGICAGDNGTFVWGVLNGDLKPQLFSNSWSASTFPDGYLVPVCVCNGQPASNRILVRLANSEPFIPLLDSGFSYLSTIVMETCAVDSAVKVYWPPSCKLCRPETTKSCVLVSKVNLTSNVMCNCYHGFDSVSRCASIADECTARVMPHNTETGRDLCQVGLGNNCSTDGTSYMCTCYMPYFENKTLSNFPNCRGQRAYDRMAADCESRFCGHGVCVSSLSWAGASCRCNAGYAGRDCTDVLANVTAWGEWGDCYPACGNIGSQRRVRECHAADGDRRFCEGLRRQFRRCQPSRCFEGDQFPVFIHYLSDPLPTNLYLWTFASFTGVFLLVYCAGLLLAMGANFQDWKLDAVNQSGKLAFTVDEVCDELMQTGDERLQEDFFRANVFVPHPVVDHLTGVQRLRRLGKRKKKHHKKAAKDKAKAATAAAASDSDGEREVNGEGESGSGGSSSDAQQLKKLGNINFVTLFEKKKKKLQDEDDVGEPATASDGQDEGESESDDEGEGESGGEVGESEVASGVEGTSEDEVEGAVEDAEMVQGEDFDFGVADAVEDAAPADEEGGGGQAEAEATGLDPASKGLSDEEQKPGRKRPTS